MVEGPSGGNGRAAIGEIIAVGSRPAGSGRIALQDAAKPGEPVLRWRSRAHSISEIEQELSRIWAEPNLETLVEGAPGRRIGARTSVMNLVVIARRTEVGERAAATIQQLTGRHPSRTIVVATADPDGPSWLDAQVEAHCVLPHGDSPEICAESIYLTAGGESGRHLQAIVTPLLIHDLPVTVWWPGEPPFGTAQANEILEAADRLVVDGSTWSEEGLSRLVQLAALYDTTGLSIRDFALVRQSRWRDAIASIFDMPEFLPYLRSIRRIAVAYATHDETGSPGSTNLVKPVYHVAWLASRDARDAAACRAPGHRGGAHEVDGSDVAADVARPLGVTRRRTGGHRRRRPARAVPDALGDDAARRAPRGAPRLRAPRRRHGGAGDCPCPRLGRRHRGPRPTVRRTATHGRRSARGGDRGGRPRRRHGRHDPDGGRARRWPADGLA